MDKGEITYTEPLAITPRPDCSAMHRTTFAGGAEGPWRSVSSPAWVGAAYQLPFSRTIPGTSEGAGAGARMASRALRMITAVRSFSAHDRAERARCHAAWRSRARLSSLLIETRPERPPLCGETVLAGQLREAVVSDCTRLSQGEHSRKILGAPDAEGDAGQVVGTNDS